MSESANQCALLKWWDMAHKQYNLPAQMLMAIPNGGQRNAITGAILKREGVRAGVFDLFLAAPRNGFSGLWLEMKWGKNKITKEQQAFKAMIEAEQGKCVVCYDWETAKEQIEAYLDAR